MSGENNQLKYSDLYDQLTVEECRRLVKSFEEGNVKIPSDYPQREQKIVAHNMAQKFLLWHTTGERAAKKAETIRAWMTLDARQEKLVVEVEPRSDIYCLRCRERMRFMDKHLDSSEKGDRVLLFYECLKGCLPRRAFYNDGSEFRSKPHTCAKCHSSVSEKSTRNGELIIITSICEKCGYSETEEMDLSPRKQEIDEHFAEDRVKYCLSDNELHQYQDGMRHMEGMNFAKVEISNPTTSEGLRVKLTALDNDRKRSDSEAITATKSALEIALKDTNWRVVKNSLSLTLGALLAELRGYVSETEIRQLFEAETQ